MFKCCSGTRKRNKILPYGSVVLETDEENTLDILRKSMNSFQSVSSNGGNWIVRLSDRVENSNIWAISAESATRLAQWYAYLDYKELKARIYNE
jgi:hypothetical protein